MKALVLSDLYLEFEPIQLPLVDVDLVILAGDIHKGTRGVHWASDMFSAPVLYVPQVAGHENSDSHLSASYTNNWHSLVDQSNFWIFGHTHHSVDVTLGRCRLISNSRGYPVEQTGFDRLKIIEF
ncbi:hypothetical protein [Pseudomonas sp. BLCC-B112]|uniref:hypothetical protein n=1 Tax=Pseudomonas sp. BLCC-B112 TaxID=3025319 RepID=UPI00234C0EB9|nr:hypothetical protein [Pseudomonas sp. BLCC-B112]MDC7815653.1 hypothetical protein [Pseudomonas sp. BLCC-B112]